MLCWLAVQAERSSIERDLERRSREVLAASGHDWASIVFDGRDGLLVGNPDKPGAIAEAAALVRNVWGVRVVRTREPFIATATSRQVFADVPMTPAATVALPSTELSDSPPVGPGAQGGRHATPDTIASTGNSTNAPTNIAAVEVAGRRAKEVGVSAIPVVASREVAVAEATASAAPAAMAQPPLPKSRDVAVLQALAAEMQGGAGVVGGADTAVAAVEFPEHKPGPQPTGGAGTSVSVPQLPQHKPPLSSAQAPPEPAKEQPSAAAKASDVAMAPASAPLPDRKPEISPRETSPRPADVEQGRPEVFAMPAADGEKSVKPAASTIIPTGPSAAAKVPLPEPKKQVLAAAHPTNAAPRPAVSAAADKARKPATAQPPASPPRFETAALPPGNIVDDASCVKTVSGAAEVARVHFAPDDFRLDPPGKAAIDGLVASLNACPGLTLRISGHADASGQSRHNKTLSERRARSVAAYMIDKGIDAGRLVAVGYGDKQPVAPNDREANRAKNRRIELAITVQRAPLPPLPVRKQGTRNGLSGR